MKSNILRYRQRGFTLVELMIVVAIISILSSMVIPRFDLLMQKAQQSSTRGNLGIIRTTIGLYYSDNEGLYPMQGYPDGYPADSLSQYLSPKYIEKLPTPKLSDRAPDWNGVPGWNYDRSAGVLMGAIPVEDVYIFQGPPGGFFAVERPFVYDSHAGLIYICSYNLDTTGNNFFNW